MTIKEYRQFSVNFAAEISKLVVNDKSRKELFRSHCKEVEKNGKLATWMEWYYRPAPINTFQPPDADFQPTDQQKVQAAFCILSIHHDVTLNPPPEDVLCLPGGEIKDVFEETKDKPRPPAMVDYGFLDRTCARLKAAFALVEAHLPPATDMGMQPAFVNKQPKMNISNTDLSALKIILSAVEEWKRIAGKDGPESKEAQQLGSQTVKLLYQHVKLLDDFCIHFIGSGTTQTILSDLTKKVSSVNPAARQFSYFYDYDTYCQENFIADLKRWIKEASEQKKSDNSRPVKSEQVPWDDTNPDYIYASEALTVFQNETGLTRNPAWVGKTARNPKSRIRYMKQPRRFKVHRNNWRQYINDSGKHRILNEATKKATETMLKKVREAYRRDART